MLLCDIVAGEQANGTLANQRGGVGHGPHCWCGLAVISLSPRLEASKGDASSDTEDNGE